MWSCGAILCDMFMGSTPHLARTGWNVTAVLQTLDMPREARDIVARLMIPVPAERATALQILQEVWVTKGMDVGMTHMNDTARHSSPSAMDITEVRTLALLKISRSLPTATPTDQWCRVQFLGDLDSKLGEAQVVLP